MKMIAYRHRHAAYHNSTGDVLLVVLISMILKPKNTGF